MSKQGEIKGMRKDAEDRGWIIDKTNSGHWRWRFPENGGFFYSAGTPACPRAYRNIEAHIKKIEAGTHPNCERKRHYA